MAAPPLQQILGEIKQEKIFAADFFGAAFLAILQQKDQQA